VRNGRLIVFAFVAGLFVVLGSAFAHHGRVEYENKSVTLQARVTRFDWNNPHVIISFTVKDENGVDQGWHAEVLPPSLMEQAGWTADSIKPGDQVTVVGRPGKKGEHIMWLEYLVTPGGQKLGRGAS
jgi:hypothetical protein